MSDTNAPSRFPYPTPSTRVPARTEMGNEPGYVDTGVPDICPRALPPSSVRHSLTIRRAFVAPRLTQDVVARGLPFVPRSASESIFRHPAIVDGRQALATTLLRTILYWLQPTLIDDAQLVVRLNTLHTNDRPRPKRQWPQTYGRPHRRSGSARFFHDIAYSGIGLQPSQQSHGFESASAQPNIDDIPAGRALHG